MAQHSSSPSIVPSSSITPVPQLPTSSHGPQQTVPPPTQPPLTTRTPPPPQALPLTQPAPTTQVSTTSSLVVSSLLGIHPIDRTNKFLFNSKSPSKLLGYNVRYPTGGGGGFISKSFTDIWNGLTDKGCGWNIVDRMSKVGTGLTACPIMAKINEQTVGNINICKQRIQTKGDDFDTWYNNNRTSVSENWLFRQLSLELYKEYGTLLQGYRTNTYMQCLTDSLEITTSDIENGISPVWVNVSELRGIDINTVKSSNECIALVKSLKGYVKSGNMPQFDQSVKKLIQQQKKATKSNKLRFIKSTSDALKNYLTRKPISKNKTLKKHCAATTEENIRNIFTIMYIKTIAREVDFLVMLPQYKCILQMEVKDADISDEPDITKAILKLENRKKEGEEQLQTMGYLLKQVHGDVLSNWYHIRVLAFPSVEKACFPPGTLLNSSSADDLFILFKEDVESGLAKWWNKLKMEMQTKLGCILSTPSADDQVIYEEMMKRLVGMSRFGDDMRTNITESVEKIHEQLVGKGAEAVLAGARLDDTLPSGPPPKLLKRLKETDENERLSLNVLLWTKNQQDILDSDPQKKILFSSDFGTGKTLLMKTKAKEVANGKPNSVYYISLGAVDYRESPYKKVYDLRTVFDLVTEEQFSGTDVVFLSAPALRNKYLMEKEHGDEDDLKTLRDESEKKIRRNKTLPIQQDFSMLVIWMCIKHADADFFIDEFGVYSDRMDFAFKIIRKISDIVKGRVWMSVRKVGLFDKQEYDEFASSLKNGSYVVPDLPVVMRTSGEINNSINRYMINIHSNYNDPRLLGESLDTVPGSLPKVIHAPQNTEIIARMIVKLIQETGDNRLVVLTDNDTNCIDRIQNICTSFKKLKNVAGIQYMLVDATTNVEQKVREYLSNNDGRVLFTDVMTFSGMEARTVVYLNYGGNLAKDGALRTTSNLFVIIRDNPIQYNQYIDAGFHEHRLDV